MEIMLEPEAIADVQMKLDYRFKNPRLLTQAFTRKSFAVENGCADSEILEFLGDAVLGYIRTNLLLEKYGDEYQAYPHTSYGMSVLSPYNLGNASRKEFTVQPGVDEGFLTEKRKQYIKGTTLAQCIDYLEFSQYLLMGKGERKKHTENQPSVKEDLFEAILGAVAVDSKNNYLELEKVVRNMMEAAEYFLERDSTDEDSYYDLVQHWHQKEFGEVAHYSVERDIFGTQYTASVGIEYNDGFSTPHTILFRGFGQTKREAKEEAAHKAYSWLDENNLLFTEYDVVNDGNLTWENAINKLQELYQAGFCSEPVYEFDDAFYNEKGRVFWPCTCTVDGWNEPGCEAWSSKKVSKKFAAFSALCYHFGWQKLYDETVKKFENSVN